MATNDGNRTNLASSKIQTRAIGLRATSNSDMAACRFLEMAIR